LTDAIKVFTILLKPILTKGVNEIIKQMNFTNEMLEYKNIDDTDIVNNLKVNKNTPIYDRIKNN
jgi:methionyl-tRNA synthetase